MGSTIQRLTGRGASQPPWQVAALGAVAGTWGVAGMAGVITTLRRGLVPPDELVKTHPEKVIERAWQAAGGDVDQLDVMTRRRLGDLLHFGFGAFWGAVYALVSQQRELDPLKSGTLVGAALWIGAFCGYMPLLGIQEGAWHWKGRELVLTGSAHAAYGVTMAVVLRSLRTLT